MFSLRRFLLTISLSLFALGAVASPENPNNGSDYTTLATPQPADAGKKVEVLEFFMYACPHCYAFEPSLAEWVKKQGDKIVFKRVHVAFSESVVPQQRMYFALEAMGKVEELHKKIFNAIHVEHQALNKEDAIVEFVVKQGIDKTKFLELYNSFSMQTKTNRATQMQASYKIDGVPTVAIDGRFLTSPSMVHAGLPPKTSEAVMQSAVLQVMDVLVAKVIKEREANAKPVAASAKPVAASAKTSKTSKTKIKKITTPESHAK
jgi:thiol:disulfide interchange protein DsbA